jgi:hypothetical protein
VAAPSLSRDTSTAGEAEYGVDRFFLLPRSRRLDSEACITAARRTERFTDHATIARQASRVRPTSPSAAPTAMNTVPSGALLSCIYGALAVGGIVTIAPPVVVVVEEEEEDVDDVVVVETEDVVVLPSDVVEEEEEEDVVVVSMVVVVEEEEEEVLVVELDVDFEVVEDVVVSLTLEML